MRQRLLRNKVRAGVLALAGSVTPAIAQGISPTATAIRHAGRPIIVLEPYVGQRPANAGMIMEPLLGELAVRGAAVRPAPIVERIGDRAPRPGVRDKDKTTAEVTQLAGWAGAL